ncbi:hypothetical protein F6R98_06490 [Candidatus Methylospira mobilis]|uniref:Uncharacterized protein n=1 Tax=Candidatus Methylospira mobilis TaxID=1808979 RepID=A0A5Q0BJI1_9GAMM|nr:hypothetical protein [Candidatus Methylospira mobilis]QFY42318.1 hypothetical protein F6R98_06490 [Candidatus Methylospira mobilis]
MTTQTMGKIRPESTLSVSQADELRSRVLDVYVHMDNLTALAADFAQDYSHQTGLGGICAHLTAASGHLEHAKRESFALWTAAIEAADLGGRSRA